LHFPSKEADKRRWPEEGDDEERRMKGSFTSLGEEFDGLHTLGVASELLDTLLGDEAVVLLVWTNS
jgi:hypothetical protein